MASLPLTVLSSVLILLNLRVLEITTSDTHETSRTNENIKRALLSPQFFESLKLRTPSTAANYQSNNDQHPKPPRPIEMDHIIDDDQCVSQFNAVLVASERSEIWAMSMLDSWGKFPSGILFGNNNDLGNFDECFHVNHPIVETNTTTSSIVAGKYCLAQMYSAHVDMPRRNEITHSLSIKGMDARMLAQWTPNQTFFSVFVAVCVPVTCSSAMVDAIVDKLTAYVGLPFQASVTEELCSDSRPLPFNLIDVATITIFGMIIIGMTASTVYDVRLLRSGQPRNGFLVAFSVYTNSKYIFQRQRHAPAAPEQQRQSIDCLHGVRMLSLSWVILGHSYLNMAYGPTVNTFQYYEWLKTGISMAFVTTTVCVDSFFMISGLLVTISLLKYLDRTSGQLNIIWFYVHRYIRLTPALAAITLVYTSLSRHFGDGPLWNVYQGGSIDRCRQYWWSVLLYLQNYVNPDSMCLGHLWYLSVDMQLYMFSPVLIYPLWRWRYKFLAIVPTLTVLSVVATFVLYVVYEFSARLSTNLLTGRRMTLVYYNTPCRMGPWLVGVFLGFFQHELRGKRIVIQKLWTSIGWTCSFGTFGLVFLLNFLIQSPTHEESVLEGAFYEATSRVAWSAALAWLVFACIHGYGGPINWLLSLPGWQPFARMAYSIYLLNLPVQMVMASRLRAPAYFSDLMAFNTFWASSGYTVILSVFWTMAFDSPMLAIERELTRKKPVKRTQDSDQTQECKDIDMTNQSTK